MIELAFAALNEIATSVAGNLFSEYISEKITDPFKKYKAETSKKRVEDKVISLLHSSFEKDFGTEECLIVINELKNALKKANVTVELIVLNKYNPDSLTQSILRNYGSKITNPAHLNRYEHGVNVFCKNIIYIANILPDWEKANWAGVFKSFDDLSAKLDETNEMIQKIVTEPEERNKAFEISYKKYLIRENKNVHMKGIGNISDVSPMSLKDIFVPLSFKRVDLVTDNSIEPIRINDDKSSEKKMIEKSFSIEEVLLQNDKIVIIGKPGAGKTTLIKHMTLNVSYGNLETEGNLSNLVPFVFKVRSLKDFDDLPSPNDFIAICANLLDNSHSSEFVTEILQSKRALIIIDGVDECELPLADKMLSVRNNDELTEWDKLIDWIFNLSDIYNGNKFVITSRPVGYKKDLLKSKTFAEFEIKNLSEEQQQKLVNNWCLAVEKISTPDISQEEAVKLSILASNDLMRRLKTAKSVKVLAETPLMLTAVCIVHRYKGHRLPERRVDLLNECVDILVYEFKKAEGLRKNLIGDLDSKKLRGIIEPLAYEMTISQQTEVEEVFVLEQFMKYLPEIGQNPDRANEILKIIQERSGVIVEASPKKFSFAHLIFQEYLTSVELCNRGVAINDYFGDQRWKEIVLMTTALSRGSNLIILEDLISKNYWELAGRALIESERIPLEIRDNIIKLVSKNCTKDTGAILLLSEIGDENAALEFIKLILYFPVLPIAESIFFAKNSENYNDKESKIEIEDFSIKVGLRSKFISALSIPDDWKGRRYLCFDIDKEVNNIEVSANAGSWLALNPSLSIPENPINIIEEDPIYAFAVMLDSVPNFEPFFILIMFDKILKEQEISTEHQALALILISEHLEKHFHLLHKDTSKFLLMYLGMIESLEPNNYPGLQIGLLNHLKKRYGNYFDSNINDIYCKIWSLCLEQVEIQTSELINEWTKDFVFTTKNELKKVDFINMFKEAFRKELSNK